ncbi:MAG TPA: universal stress protein [Anaeromyxobacteraceae bacterium]
MAELAWKKVLCPVDFSEESRSALRVAVDLARRFGAELTLFHADTNANVSTVLKDAESADGELAAWKREAEAQGIASVKTASRAGEPQLAIVDQADQGGFDLVVMGTHGRTGRDRSLIGSVAENVVRRSRVPVLTVHAEWKAAR